jgi:hypothetical protein
MQFKYAFNIHRNNSARTFNVADALMDVAQSTLYVVV